MLSVATTLMSVLSADVSAVTLNNGMKFPLVSFGLQVYDDVTAASYTKLAVQAGVRNFFSSVLADNQRGFSSGLAETAHKSNLKREEFFICGSVNTGDGLCNGFEDCKTKTAVGCSQNLDDLGSGTAPGSKASFLEGYLDMIMLDYPADDCDSIRGQWTAFEEMLSNGTTKSVSVSNFSPSQLDCIVENNQFENGNFTIPAVNQMPYNAEGSGSDTSVADDAARGGILVQAYSPLASGGIISDPDCIAIGKKHNKTAAQVGLRWIIQRRASFTTSASTIDHFKEDLDIFDFELTETEMATLNAKQGL